MRQPWINFILRCPHKRMSMPIRTGEPAPDGRLLPHVTCFDCGRQFWYDWDRMRLSGEKKAVEEERAA